MHIWLPFNIYMSLLDPPVSDACGMLFHACAWNGITLGLRPRTHNFQVVLYTLNEYAGHAEAHC